MKGINRLTAASEMIDFLTNHKNPFVIRSTMTSKTVFVDDEKYFLSDLNLSNKGLGYISKVKKDAKKFDSENEKFLRSQKINYTHIKNIPVGNYSNYVELDLNSAYHVAAYKLGVITKATFEYGLTLSKVERLVGLGALASEKSEFEFDGKKLEYKGSVDKKEDLGHIFFMVSNEIGKIVSGIYDKLNSLKKDGCLGYWVDAVFVKRELEHEAIKIIEDAGFEYKRKDLTNVLCRVKKDVKCVWFIEKQKNKNVCGETMEESSFGKRRFKNTTSNFLFCPIRVKPFMVESYKKKMSKTSSAKRALELTLRIVR